MKRLLFLVLLTIGGLFVCEAKVTVNEAKIVAVNWLNSTSVKQFNSSNIVEVISKTENETPLYHIVVFEPAGWVMVSGSEKVDPVLGYSDNSEFDKNEIPVQLKSWLGGISKEVKIAASDKKYLPKQGVNNQWSTYRTKFPKQRVLKSTAGATAGPLLPCNWNQGRYFNEMAPVDALSSAGNGHVWIGCVATAMVQVMKYWAFPTTGMSSHSYNHPTYGTQSVDYGSAFYDWPSMPNTLSSTNSEVAEISYHAAVSVDMQFGPGGSGAYLSDASAAMVDYFKYNSTTFNTSKNYWDDSEWKAQIKRDIDNGRPVIYSGYSPSYTEGHAWVCDGYSNDYFHFNFGWGGSGNGNFLLSAINPSSRDYTNDQGAVFSIEPISPTNIATPYSIGFESSNSGLYSLMGVYSFSNDEQHSGASSVCLSKPSFAAYSQSNVSLAFTVPFEANLSFWVKRQTPQSTANNEQRAVIMTENGSTVLVEVFRGDFNDSDWQNYTVDLSSYSGQNVRLMIVQQNYDFTRDQWMYVDDIVITGSNQNLAPFTPSIPIPADGATSIAVSPLLKWSGGDPNGDGVIYKVHFGTTSNPPLVGSVFDNQYSFSDLLPNKKYYWKIISDDGTLSSTGPVWSFTTQGIPPVMGICGISNITSDSAQICGEIVNNNGATILSKGICWGLTQYPTIYNSNVSSLAAGSQYSCDLSSLEPFTTYYVRSYVISNEGVAYSGQQTFTTLPGLAQVSYRSVTNVQRTIATINGLVDDVNDNSIISRGVVWSQNQNFDVATAVVASESGNWTATGPFSINLINLPGPGTIYFRTFVQNSVGKSYSAEGEFQTLNTPPVIDLDGNNSTTLVENSYSGFVVEQQDGGRIADIDVLISDFDNDTIQQVKVVLFEQLFDTDEFLLLDYSHPSLIVEGNGTDTLLLSSDGTLTDATWSEIISEIELHVNNDAPDPMVARKVRVQVYDGYSNSAPSISTLYVIPVNDKPVATTAPIISQTPVFGHSVSVVPGVWSDVLDNCSGANQATYQWLAKDASGKIDTLIGETGQSLMIKTAYCAGAVAVVETIIDSNCGGTNVVTASKTSEWYSVQKEVQSISFDPVPTQSYSLVPFILTGSSSSGLPLSFDVANKNIADVEGNELNMFALGKTVVYAIQEGNSCFEASEKTYRILTIEKGIQEIIYQDKIVAFFHEHSIPLAAQSSAGLELQVASSDTSKAYVKDGRIYLAGTGDVVLFARQQGNDYLAPAEQVEINLTIEKGTQNIDASVDQILAYGVEPINMNVEVSSGLTPVVSSSDENIIQVIGNKIHVIGVGACIVSITQPGNEFYSAAQPVVLNLTVEKGNSLIDFAVEPEMHYDEGPYTFSVNSSSSQPVHIESSDESIVEVIQNKLFVKGVGEVKLTMNCDGNELWNSANQVFTLNVLKGNQVLSNVNAIEKHYGDDAFVPNVTSSAGLPVVFDIDDESIASIADGKVVLNGVGQASIRAIQSGNNLWEAADQLISLSVYKGIQNVTFDPITMATYGDKSVELHAVSANKAEITYSSSNENVAVASGNKLIIFNAGETIITASQPGSDLWEASEEVAQLFTVNKAHQQISATFPTDLITSEKVIFADFETTSGLTIDELISSDENIVKVVGDSLLLLDKGLVEITAIQYGNENYLEDSCIVQLSVSYPLDIDRIEDLEFSVFPNPASQLTQLSLSGDVNYPIKVQLINVNGEVVSETIIDQPISMLKIDKLRQGVYFIHLNYNDRTATKKLIVR